MSKARLLLLAILAGALMAAPAMAGIQNTPHELTGLTVGTQPVQACAVCHIPHGGGARLWATTTPGSAYVGVIADLCATCHVTAGGYQAALAAAGYEPASDSYVYHAASHGAKMAITNIDNSAPTNGLTTSNLPYTGAAGKPAPVGGVMECTSCHDVHNNIAPNAPFLWVALEDLCQKCHAGRTPAGWTAGAFGSWPGTARRTNNLIGSHPVGTDVIADTTGDIDANSPIVALANLSANLKQLKTITSTGSWSLGGHLGTANAISCNTCHAVHGLQRDADDTGSPAITATSPVEDFLAIDQNTGSSEGYTSPINNGDAGYNALCEACHQGGTQKDTYWWNPGATAFGHPVDTYVVSTANFSTSFLANLPAGGLTGTAPLPNPQPICESCHSPHIGAWKTAGKLTATRNADGGPFIIRAQTNLCDFCHNGTGTITKHHPGGTLGVYGVSTTLGVADGSTLGCGTCHVYSTATAGSIHNWTASGRPADLALKSGWLPANNAPRGSALTAGTLINANTSQICLDCHVGIGQARGAADYNPTKNTNTLNSHYEALGDGSHFVGPTTAAFMAGGYIRNATTTTAFNATNTRWPDIDNGAVQPGYFSRFDGTTAAPIVVCESCHNLDPDVNNGYKLTVAYYREGDPYNQQYSPLCEGCHGWPASTHPVTDNTVPSTGATLKTTALKTQPATGPTYGPAAVSCDSCHQPHSAAGDSLIIDTSTTVTGGSAVLQQINSKNVVDRRNKANQNIPTYSPFCQECHNY